MTKTYFELWRNKILIWNFLAFPSATFHNTRTDALKEILKNHRANKVYYRIWKFRIFVFIYPQQMRLGIKETDVYWSPLMCHVLQCFCLEWWGIPEKDGDMSGETPLAFWINWRTIIEPLGLDFSLVKWGNMTILASPNVKTFEASG